MEKNFNETFNIIKQHVICVKTNFLTNITDFAFQFEIIGEGHGIFYIEYKNNNLNVEPYDYYDHSARIIASADTIIELISGKITINDSILFGDINIISNVDDGVKKAISFFYVCYNSKNLINETLPNSFSLEHQNPWDALRIYIEQSNIDEESKNQLLANLVKFTSKELHILIVGACGCGKSSTINALFNMEIAQVGYGVDPETQEVSVYKLDNLYLHDSPGLGESTEKDKEHIKKIKAALQEKDTDGNAVIDIVLVIVDGSHRDMKSSFELINDVVIPNLQQKDRILIGINRCDLALNGRGWIEQYNYPNEELLLRLKEKSESVRERIKNDTGVDVEPVFYSALHKYNISKLLSYLVKSAPAKKRIFFAEKINKNPDNFLRDDTMSLIKRNSIQHVKKDFQHTPNYNNLHFESDKLYNEVSSIKSAVSGIEKKIETMHTDIKSSNVKTNNPSEHNTETNGPKTAQIKEETDNNIESEYELIKTDNKQYKQEFQSSMEEAFEAASAEISKGSKEKIKFSFVNMLDSIKQSAKSGAELGKEIGKHVPYIGVTVGSAIGAVLGSVGGFLTNLYRNKRDYPKVCVNLQTDVR